MDTKYKVGIAGAALLASFAAGRYTVPEKVTTKTDTSVKTKTKKNTTTNTKKDEKKRITKDIITRPDGTKEEKVTIDVDTNTDKKQVSDQTKDSNKNTETTTETVRGDSKVTVSFMLGVDFFRGPSVTPVYGLSVYKPVLGPFGIGLYGLTNNIFGVNIGVSF